MDSRIGILFRAFCFGNVREVEPLSSFFLMQTTIDHSFPQDGRSLFNIRLVSCVETVTM